MLLIVYKDFLSIQPTPKFLTIQTFFYEHFVLFCVYLLRSFFSRIQCYFLQNAYTLLDSSAQLKAVIIDRVLVPALGKYTAEKAPAVFRAFINFLHLTTLFLAEKVSYHVLTLFPYIQNR